MTSSLARLSDAEWVVLKSLIPANRPDGRSPEHTPDGSHGPPNLDDKTTEYAYGPAGMTSLTARLAGGGGQTTQWVYGVTTATGSGLDSNDAKGATRWPDPATGLASAAQQETVTVNALGQPLTSTDRNGTTHAVAYDVLGRVTDDAVTLLGVNVDGSVRRVRTVYDGQGNAYLLTNYTAPTGGTVVSQVQRSFNGLGQLLTEYQAHGAAVNTATTPKVQYAYSALDAANRSRPASVTYPNGRVVASDYGTAGQLNDKISRLGSLQDGATTLEAYAYLGLGTVVTRSHPQPGIDLTYVKRTDEAVLCDERVGGIPISDGDLARPEVSWPAPASAVLRVQCGGFVRQKPPQESLMVSPRKSAANARNAARSTGPRTAGGKARSSLNAVAHGLRAVAPVLPGEDASQWEAYRVGIVAELRACGTLENEMAGRVAAISWRLRRIVGFEVAAATTPPPPPMDPQTAFDLFGRIGPRPKTLAAVVKELGNAEAYLDALRRLAGLLARLRDGGPFSGAEAMFLLRESANALPDPERGADVTPDVDGDEFQTAVGVPESCLQAPEAWGGWDAAAVRVGLKLLSDSAGWTPERLITGVARLAVEGGAEGERRCATLRGELVALESEAAHAEVRARQFRAIPAEHILRAVTRYEPYLARQLADAIDLLERVQASRHAADAAND